MTIRYRDVRKHFSSTRVKTGDGLFDNFSDCHAELLGYFLL
ncbi:MAG: hypothetical protein WC151_07970 [Bacteroidales bacterium]|nr:hypothetical protein [Bacteroidales bacterium]